MFVPPPPLPPFIGTFKEAVACANLATSPMSRSRRATVSFLSGAWIPLLILSSWSAQWTFLSVFNWFLFSASAVWCISLIRVPRPFFGEVRFLTFRFEPTFLFSSFDWVFVSSHFQCPSALDCIFFSPFFLYFGSLHCHSWFCIRFFFLSAPPQSNETSSLFSEIGWKFNLASRLKSWTRLCLLFLCKNDVKSFVEIWATTTTELDEERRGKAKKNYWTWIS